MNAEEFVASLREHLLDATVADYREILNTETEESARDPYWRKVLELCASLNPEQRAVIIQIMRQVSFDTISGFLAILDGATILPDHRKDFFLSYDGGGKLNGYLQDYFLADET